MTRVLVKHVDCCVMTAVFLHPSCGIVPEFITHTHTHTHTHTLASQWRPKILKTTVGAATVERCRFWLKVCVDSSRPVLK